MTERTANYFKRVLSILVGFLIVCREHRGWLCELRRQFISVLKWQRRKKASPGRWEMRERPHWNGTSHGKISWEIFTRSV